MRPIAADVARCVVCLSVCWSHGCAVQIRLNRSRARVLELTHVSPRNRVLIGSRLDEPIRRPRGDKTAMRPFAKLLRTLVAVSLDFYS